MNEYQMRAFIAIEMDPIVKENLTKVISRFKKISSHVKWVKSEAMHLTLKFLGTIKNQKATLIKDLLDRVSDVHDGFHLECKGLGTFPQKSKKPRVIWAGMSECPSLMALQSDIEKECESIGFLREKRGFHPHLTLGRIKKQSQIQDLLAELKINPKTDFGITEVDRVILFKSTLTPTGAVYDKVYESHLK
ncbi:MAG: RNA 2',3'-cyclic phosphodiesterase [Candidatus Aminicenantes bacterium]|nr:RNA 2',3'-cyclic phosphodiesterase [Candidatus Aminicenantes bacterium]